MPAKKADFIPQERFDLINTFIKRSPLRGLPTDDASGVGAALFLYFVFLVYPRGMLFDNDIAS